MATRPQQPGASAIAAGPGAEVIVCGVDDRAWACDVARLASDLSTRLDARLLLVHVAPPAAGPGMATVPGAAAEMRSLELERAEELLARVSECVDGECEIRATVGNPSVELARVAREESATLIVIGSRGRRPVAAALFGSVAATLGRDAPCPVVVVTAEALTSVPVLA